MTVATREKCPCCDFDSDHYFANDDNYVEATVDINTDKSMSLIVGDYYGDDTDEIKINY